LLEEIVRGISDGCVDAGCALLGGETAIMPDVYHGDDYDLAGFCVGVVDRPEAITGKEIRPGDVIVGVASSGVHSNGYSLARKIVFEKAGLKVEDTVEELGTTVGDALIRPTVIYASLVRKVLMHYRVKNVIHGIGHITGGGLLENTERILPPNVDLVFKEAWEIPQVFRWLQRLGEVPTAEMFRVFNMGVGLTFIVSPYYAQAVLDMVHESGQQGWIIGEAKEGTGKSRWA
jgi:phosphoribosylformylglycinamidine cyclo-ligase